jgi:transposase
MNNPVDYLGIDVSKDRLDVHFQGKALSVPNRPEGFAQLRDRFGSQAHWLCEASGPYHLPLLAYAQQHGLAISVLNPRQVRDFARAQGILAKTDALDARVLAHYGRLFQPAPTLPLPAGWADLAALIALRLQLLDMATAQKNRLAQHPHPFSAKLLRAHLRQLQAHLLRVQRQLDQLVCSHPDLQAKCQRLTQVKGVGTITALSLLAALPELGSLSRTQLAALSGTAPLNRDSGQGRGHRSTWGGRAHARRALYMAALVASRRNPVLAEVYRRLRSNGKCPKVALTALMRKLAIHLNSLLRQPCPSTS